MISLAIPRPSRSRIHWPINFSKKIDDSIYFQQQKSAKLKRREGSFQLFELSKLCYHFLSSFEIIFFDVPSYPLPIAVQISLTNQFFQKSWCFCIFLKQKKGQVYIGISILVIPDHIEILIIRILEYFFLSFSRVVYLNLIFNSI